MTSFYWLAMNSLILLLMTLSLSFTETTLLLSLFNWNWPQHFEIGVVSISTILLALFLEKIF